MDVTKGDKDGNYKKGDYNICRVLVHELCHKRIAECDDCESNKFAKTKGKAPDNFTGGGNDGAEFSAVKCENYYIDVCGDGQAKRSEQQYNPFGK